MKVKSLILLFAPLMSMASGSEYANCFKTKVAKFEDRVINNEISEAKLCFMNPLFRGSYPNTLDMKAYSYYFSRNPIKFYFYKSFCEEGYYQNIRCHYTTQSGQSSLRVIFRSAYDCGNSGSAGAENECIHLTLESSFVTIIGED